MNSQPLIPAKATTVDDQSDAIVVSFGVEWQKQIIAKDFSIVIRKRVPKAATFKWLYFHVNNPIGAICARAKIDKVFTATAKEALAFANCIHLSPADITAYLAGDNSIGCYQLGAFQFPLQPLAAVEISARMVYHPPQSFFIISKQAKIIIDQMAGFSTAKDLRSGKKSKP